MQARLIAAAASAAIGANAAPGLSAVGALRFPGILKRVEAAPGDLVALTFDDGPHPQGTPAVMAELERLGLSASFFLVGRDVRRNPGLVGELVAAGHEIAVHGDRHLPHPLMPPGWVTRDLERANATIEDIAGSPVRYLRAPFGAASLATLRFARRESLTLASWSRWGRDWERRATAASVARRLTRNLTAGDVLLLHDSDAYSAFRSWQTTVAALPAIAEVIAGAGLRAVPLVEAVAQRRAS